MGNCVFAYPDRTLQAISSKGGSIGGGSWEADLPVTNLQDRLRGKVARTTGVDAAQATIQIDFGVPRVIQMIALINHNASMTATWSAGMSLTGFNDDVYSTGSSYMWPISYYPTTIPYEWAEDNWWSGSLYDADADDFRPSPDVWLVLPEPITCQYVTISISDADNTADYFQLGRCFIAPIFQTAINLDFGASVVWKQDVIKAKSLGGVESFHILSQGREIAGTLANMSLDEGMVHVFDRQRRLGQEGELYFIFDPDDTLGVYRQRAMLCRFGNEDPLQFPTFDSSSGSFNLVEVR